MYILTSSFDTKLIDDRTSGISAEDLARSILGKECIINYLSDSKISREEFYGILERNMRPVYDSARRQGYEIWMI